jgi:heme o synthase
MVSGTSMGNARKFQILLLVTAIMIFSLIVMGGIVRVTGSGQGCPDWPLCYGKLFPPSHAEAIVDYVHRLVALLATVLILISAVFAWLRYRSIRLIFRPMMAAVGLLAVEIGLGAVTVLAKMQPVIVAVQLGVALMVLAMVLTAMVSAFRLSMKFPGSDGLVFRGSFPRLTVWTLAGLFLVQVSGVFLAASVAVRSCAGCPLGTGSILPSTRLEWILTAHRFIVGAAAILIVVLLVQAWRTQRDSLATYPAAVMTAVLFFAQMYVGALMTAKNFPVFLSALHVATAVAAWAALVILVVLTGSSSAPVVEIGKRPYLGLNQYLRDLLTLTRPIVVLLLLVTAFAAMVIGGHAWPAPGLAFWTLLGGGLAAGGAQAVNQYVDRDIDRLMMRTAKRPIPTGRLSPAEGLAWGLSLSVASVYLLAGLVNWLAALMTLVGIVYYVLIYTLLLKRTSVQNIVIGGGAGAMAPVVGLVAVTGRLDLWALLLFTIVFFWTPPHFWALALVRLKDYTAAKIPVLPVVRGVDFTRGQIMVYTVALLPITFLPTFFGIAGTIYLVSAVLLGGGMLYAAWQVWRKGTNKLAWRLYRVSSMYLAFLFFAMMADKLIK